MQLKTLSVTIAAICLAACASSAPANLAQYGPIIDVHRHAAWPGSDEQAALAEHLREMDRNGIVLSVLHINEPSDIDTWSHAAPGRFLAGPMFPCAPFTPDGAKDCFRPTDGWPDPAWLESAIDTGDVSLLGEMLFVYFGAAPSDPRFDPYWAMAARYDLPVAVHIGRGPPLGAPPRHEGCCVNFNADLGNPAHLRPVLERYPNLRIYLQHAGITPTPVLDNIDYWEETTALLRDYPQIHVDMSVVNFLWSAEDHERALRRFADTGLLDRVMFGADNGPVAEIVARIEAIEWLSTAQKRALYYDTAARFFRLDAETIARHHGQ